MLALFFSKIHTFKIYTLAHAYGCDMSSFFQNWEATICLEVLHARTTVVGFGSMLNTHIVDYCHDVLDVFRNTARIVFSFF